MFDVKIDLSALEHLGVDMIDDTTRLYMYQRLKAYFAPYVPKESGALEQSTNITPDYLEYWQPYGHYQWAGEVYGPNIPIKDPETGIVIGWFSPPQKYPTGRSLTYSTEVNANATDHWDDTAMLEHGKDIAAEIAAFIAKRFNE